MNNSPIESWSHAVALVQSCLEAGVKEVVVCAGARNALLLEVIARAEVKGLVKVWQHFEERSAGFFALGRIMDTQLPCAVVTTSGTAAAELLPAMIEAYYQARPLIAITADRPASHRYCGSPQSIIQPHLYGDYAYEGDWETWSQRIPLHINIELDEVIEIPKQAVFEDVIEQKFFPEKKPVMLAAFAQWLRKPCLNGLVVMVGGLDADEQEEVYHFCTALGAPVVAEATSGLREAFHQDGLAIEQADRLLKYEIPDKVLRLGEVPSCRFWRDLEQLTQVSVWSICRNGLTGLARESQCLQGNLAHILPALGVIEKQGDRGELLLTNRSTRTKVDELLETFPDSEPAMIHALSMYVSFGNSLFLGNSLPIREWNQFAQVQRPILNAAANRGANGIDGQISTWLGFTAFLEDAWAIMGDLTCLYDMSALAFMKQVVTKGRKLVVINNQGGRIFEQLPQMQTMSSDARRWMVQEHDVSFECLAKMWHVEYIQIRSLQDIDSIHDLAEQAAIIEIMPSSKETQSFWELYKAHL